MRLRRPVAASPTLFSQITFLSFFSAFQRGASIFLSLPPASFPDRHADGLKVSHATPLPSLLISYTENSWHSAVTFGRVVRVLEPLILLMVF